MSKLYDSLTNKKTLTNIKSLLNPYIRQASRSSKKIMLILGMIFLLFLFNKKIISPLKREKMEEQWLDFINREVDECLKLSTRREQNERFAAIKTKYPLYPLKMTLTTAVFLITDEKPYIVVKRVIMNKVAPLSEDEIAMKLRHQNIVKTYKTFRRKYVDANGESQTLIWLYMEYIRNRISPRQINKNEEKIQNIIKDTLLGLNYMHNKGIAHLDLKIGNVMGKPTQNGVIYKLIDFGYSRNLVLRNKIAEAKIPNKNYGTYPYKPPEIVLENIHGISGDIWCIGAIAWFLSLGQTPFYDRDGEKDVSLYKKFLKGEVPLFFDKRTSPELKSFISECMVINRFKRPSASELLNHPFIIGEELPIVYDSGYSSKDESSVVNDSYTR